METPRDINSLIAFARRPKNTVLADEDEAYLSNLIEMVRAGKRAVFIVEDANDRLKFMFSQSSRAEAITIMGKVIEATGKRMQHEG